MCRTFKRSLQLNECSRGAEASAVVQPVTAQKLGRRRTRRALAMPDPNLIGDDVEDATLNSKKLKTRRGFTTNVDAESMASQIHGWDFGDS